MVNQIPPDKQAAMLRNLLKLSNTSDHMVRTAKQLLTLAEQRRNDARAMMALTVAGDLKNLRLVRDKKISASMVVSARDSINAHGAAARKLARLEVNMQVMTIGGVFPTDVITKAREHVQRGHAPLHDHLRALLTDEVMAGINQRTGQENDRGYLAYVLEYALGKETTNG